MANWQPFGSVEVCVGTDGVTGVYVNDYAGVVRVNHDKTTMYSLVSKAMFESKHCQPHEPKHRLIESGDGSVCVVSTEEQDGKPVRMAMVRKGISESWVVNFPEQWRETKTKTTAIALAKRYVETGE